MTSRVLRAVSRALSAAFSPYTVMGLIAFALGMYLVGGQPWEGWESE